MAWCTNVCCNETNRGGGGGLEVCQNLSHMIGPVAY